MMILDTISAARPGTGTGPPALFPRYFNAKWSRDHRERSARVIRNIPLGSVSKESVRADIEAAKLASERAARIVHRKMGSGRASLASIASTAGFVGFLATLQGIAIWLRFIPERSCCDCVAGGPSEAIVPTAMGFCAAILALWFHRYLCTKLEALDTEMRVATLELANSLSLLRQRH